MIAAPGCQALAGLSCMRERLEVALNGSKNTKRMNRTPKRATGKVEVGLE